VCSPVAAVYGLILNIAASRLREALIIYLIQEVVQLHTPEAPIESGRGGLTKHGILAAVQDTRREEVIHCCIIDLCGFELQAAEE
jgi:hypothetical protein